MKLPLILYVFVTSLCFGLAGYGCDRLSTNVPEGHCTAAGLGISVAFCTLAIYTLIQGIVRFMQDRRGCTHCEPR